jgi:hypothetical protein
MCPVALFSIANSRGAVCQVDPAMVELKHLSQLSQVEFPQQRGKQVHALLVAHCPHLRSMHLGHLTALELLRVKGCSALKAVHGCSALCSLATLDLCGCTAQEVRHLSLVAPAHCCLAARLAATCAANAPHPFLHCAWGARARGQPLFVETSITQVLRNYNCQHSWAPTVRGA